MGCAEYFEFYVGEKRELEGYVLPETRGETVVINSAKYEVRKELSEEVIQSGSCDIDGNNFKAMLSFTEAGRFYYRVTLTVGEETVIDEAVITVKG